MRILIAAPLFPPDVEPAALYVKELARRLSNKNQVTVLAYCDIPEHIPGVTIIAVRKSSPRIVRLLGFALALIAYARSHDLVIAENGPSVELPLAGARLFMRNRPVLHTGDAVAARAAKRSWSRALTLALASTAAHVVTNTPPPRPEILPFAPFPDTALAEYETSWQAHLSQLHSLYA